MPEPADPHAHAGHTHAHGPGGAAVAAGDPAMRRRLTVALALAASYMVAEVVGGLWTGSLALLADAGHMLSDVAALSLALFAAWVASHPADDRWTYGRARAEILAALGQGLGLVVVALLVSVEAIERLGESREVLGPGMLAIATGGLAVNVAALYVLGEGRAHSLNVRGAWLHVLSDALGSIGAMLAGLLVWQLGWLWADPAASLAIAVLVLFSAWHLIRDAVDILMEAAPRHVDVDAIRRGLAALGGVRGVHDLHVWTLGHGQVALSCHLVVPGAEHAETLLTDAYALLGSEYAIDHATIQIEPESLADASPRSVCGGGCAPEADVA